MTDVTVIGLGSMGAALAGALLRDGQTLTVWNRTSSRADPLVRDGAVLAPDLASAVAASPVVITNLKDLALTKTLLMAPDVRPRLAGRILVQLGHATPHEAREGERWAHDSGAEYLEGEIMVAPEQIGTPEATILVAGPEPSFRRCQHVLQSLAGSTTYLGEQIGTPHAFGMAMGSVIWGAMLGAFHGALICEAEGLPIDRFAGRLREADMATVGAIVDHMLGRIESGRYDEPLGTVELAAGGAHQQWQHARDAELDTSFPEFAAHTFDRGMAAGLGDLDASALIEVLRGARRSSNT